jgi:hypothetical protein
MMNLSLPNEGDEVRREVDQEDRWYFLMGISRYEEGRPRELVKGNSGVEGAWLED